MVREKVIKGLECCATNRLRREDCEAMGCVYLDLEGHGCIHQLIRDALALLKAQEQEIEDLKQEIEGHKDNLRETLDEMMRYEDELKAQEPVEPKEQFYDNQKSQWAEKCRDVYTKWQKWQRWQKEQEAR